MHKNTFSIYIKIYKTRLNKTGRILPIRCQWSSTGTHWLDLGFADFLSNISSTHIFFLLHMQTTFWHPYQHTHSCKCLSNWLYNVQKTGIKRVFIL